MPGWNRPAPPPGGGRRLAAERGAGGGEGYSLKGRGYSLGWEEGRYGGGKGGGGYGGVVSMSELFV